jgi:hypothetical protein
MNKATKLVFLVVGAVILLLGVVAYALFHGYFDHGQFEVKQVRPSLSSKQLAIIAERSDGQALNGYTYFVLIGDHLLSPAELRSAYHSEAVVFAAANSCLTIHWEAPSSLIVSCDGSTVDASQIDVQKQHSGAISISYQNIPLK